MAEVKAGQIMVSIDKLEPNEWNPQGMTDPKFNELVEEIREDGFDDPVLVVKHPTKPEGFFRIIDGEHRWQAARVLGIPEIPCIVKDNWTDEKKQKVKTVRRNLLHGDLDKTRFTKLVHGLNDEGISFKEMPGMLGFSSEEEFREKFIAEEKEREGDDRGSVAAARQEERRESSVVENLSFILNEIFEQYGDTVPQGFVFFWHKNKFHLMVQEDEKLEKLIEAAVKYLRTTGKNVNPFLRRALEASFDEIKDKEGTDPRTLREVKGMAPLAESPDGDKDEEDPEDIDLDEDQDEVEDGSKEEEPSKDA